VRTRFIGGRLVRAPDANLCSRVSPTVDFACVDRPHPTKEPIMDTSARNYISLYDQRVRLVAHAVNQHSTLSEKDALDLAVHVLHAIDHIPEKVR
jgi:hypothetical protein